MLSINTYSPTEVVFIPVLLITNFNDNFYFTDISFIELILFVYAINNISNLIIRTGTDLPLSPQTFTRPQSFCLQTKLLLENWTHITDASCI